MRSRMLQLGLAAAAVLALAVTLGVYRGVIDVLLMVGIAAAVAVPAAALRPHSAGLQPPCRIASADQMPRTEEGSRSSNNPRATLRPMGLTGAE